jgi:hypothetical protein
MKKTLFIAFIFLVLGAVLISKAVTNIPVYFYQDDKEKFKKEIHQKIEHNKEKIAEMRADAKKTKDKVDEKLARKIDNLEQRNQKLMAKLDSYDGKSDWTKFKEEVNHDANELSMAIADVFKDNKK